MKISILTVGDEILIGQIVNTNAAWMAKQCTDIGADVVIHSSIGDDAQEMIAELHRLMEESDVVLVTGGLGPTHDDITKDVLCTFYSDTLVFHEPTHLYLQEFFAKRGRTITDRNAAQAMLPSTCEVLANTRGTAPGMLFERNGKLLFSMPGVPLEMKGIMEEYALPKIISRMNERSSQRVWYRTIQTTGIPESNLADTLGEPSSFLGTATLAFLPSYAGVRLRIGVKEFLQEVATAKLDAIQKYIENKAGEYIFSIGDVSLPEVVGSLLKEKGKTLSIAESCTSGMLGMQLTEVSGSSSFFMGGVMCYSNESKIRDVGVSRESIIAYGSVSESVASELAQGVRNRFGTDYGIGITGIAGPGGGTEEKPVGLVFIAVANAAKVQVQKFQFGANRTMNRERSCGSALAMLLSLLTQGDS